MMSSRIQTELFKLIAKEYIVRQNWRKKRAGDHIHDNHERPEYWENPNPRNPKPKTNSNQAVPKFRNAITNLQY